MKWAPLNLTGGYLNITQELYKNRIAPVKAFSDKLFLSCFNILDIKKRAEFLNKLKYILNYEKG